MQDSTAWILFVSIIGLYLIYMVISIVRRNRSGDKALAGRLGALAEARREDSHKRESLLKKDPAAGDIQGASASKIQKVNNFTHWLKHTGYDLTPLRFALMAGLLIVLSTFFIQLVLRYSLGFSFILAMPVGGVIALFIINVLINRQKNKFLVALPDALDLIRRALRSGYAADRAIQMASEESPDPIKEVLKSVIDRVSIGEPLEVALQDTANDVGIDEFRLLAIVLVLQRDTGGSLADVIENFAAIMRERLRLQKKVKAITSEGKASGYLVSAIPLAIIVILQIMSPKYLTPLFETELGHNLLLFGGGMMFLGIFTIYRMITKDYY